MNRQQWLAERKKGIGGSDIAALLGLSKYTTPFELWLDKTGRITQDKHTEQTANRLSIGQRLEPFVAELYAEKNGVQLQEMGKILRLPDHPIAMANIDRAVLKKGQRAKYEHSQLMGVNRILEIKTADAMTRTTGQWGLEGTDEIPEAYWLQVMWYMGITGVKVADIAVLFLNGAYAQYQVEYDEQVFKTLLVRAEAWWHNHVIKDIAPEPSNETEAKLRWQATTGKVLNVDSITKERIEALKAIKAKIKELEKQEQAIRDEIIPILEDGEVIEFNGLKLATYKQNKPSLKTDWKKACQGLNPSLDYLKGFQTVADGARVFRIL